MRKIMHDYLDPKCIEILQNIKTVVSEELETLIVDLVLPDQGSHWLAVSLDLVMMYCLGAMERLERQWQDLLERVLRSGGFSPARTDCAIVSSLLCQNEGLRFFGPSLEVSRAMDYGLRDVGSVGGFGYFGET